MWIFQNNVLANTPASTSLAFALRLQDIPTVNCPDYAHALGVIIWGEYGWPTWANTHHL